MIVLLVTLRSIYREQAIVTTHKQSLKKIKEKITENFKNKQLTLAAENNSNRAKIEWIWPYQNV